MEVEKIEGTLTRVDPFFLPMFQYKNAINDDQCAALIKMCEKQDYHPTVSTEYGEEASKLSTDVSVDKKILHCIPDMKEHFEL